MSTLFLNTFKQVSQHCMQRLWHDRGQGAGLATRVHAWRWLHLLKALARALHPTCPREGLDILCLNLALCVSLGGRPYHRAGELLAVADVRLAVQPDLGQLGDVTEAESVELERRPARFPVLVHEDGVVRGTPVLYMEKQCQSLHGFIETSPEVAVWGMHLPCCGPASHHPAPGFLSSSGLGWAEVPPWVPPAPTPWWSEASGSGRNTPRRELPSSCWEQLWTWGDTNPRLARNVMIADLLVITPSLAYLSLKPLASTPANMSEPISEVSTTKGASFILENLAFFERPREKHHTLVVTCKEKACGNFRQLWRDGLQSLGSCYLQAPNSTPSSRTIASPRWCLKIFLLMFGL